jgi:hypothetical protein
MAAVPQTHYRAFLSYAHEDAESAVWLHRLLSRYWVPGHRRRRIYHDKRHGIAGSLGEQIEQALRAASFLIVCWSESAAGSTWVQEEINLFLAAHPQALAENRVLVCRVGSAPSSRDDRPPDLPDSLQQLIVRDVFIPDLRGSPAQSTGRERRSFVADGLALLAPLVGMGDREQVLRIRLRWRLQAAALAVAALLTAGGGWIWRQRWLATPPGLLSQNIARAIAGARTQEINDTHLFLTARAVGRLNRRDLLEPLSQMLGPDLRELFLAEGLVSLPVPACSVAAEALGRLRADTAHTWPEPFVLVSRVCRQGWIDRVVLDPAPSQLADRAVLLAHDGYPDRAGALTRRRDFPAAQILDVRVAMAERTSAKSAAPAAELAAWIGDEDRPTVRLIKALDLAAELEGRGLQGTTLDRQLLTTAAQIARGLPNRLFNNWGLKQRLAAQLARSGDVGEARRLLDATAPRQEAPFISTVPDDDSVAWAWRGLAYHRVGGSALAVASFDAAERIAATPIPASRNWEEWGDLLASFAQAGDWTRAFRAVEAPREERARQLLRCRAVELWAGERIDSDGQAARALNDALPWSWLRTPPGPRPARLRQDPALGGTRRDPAVSSWIASGGDQPPGVALQWWRERVLTFRWKLARVSTRSSWRARAQYGGREWAGEKVVGRRRAIRGGEEAPANPGTVPGPPAPG